MNKEIAHAQSSLKCAFNGSVFFYCLPSGFQSLSICIAEGLKQLGIPLYSNVNYWRIDAEREDYLFCHNPSVTPDDCAVVVVEKGWILYHRNLPENLFHLARNYITVYLDDADGPSTAAWNPQFRNFDFIFRTHLNSKTEYPTNFVPWVFGLSNRILQETSDLPNFQQRSQHLLVNFRVPQDLMTNKEVSQERLPPGLVRIDPMRVRVEYPLRPIVRNQFCPLIEPILPVDNTIDQFEQPPSDPYHYLQWTQTVQRHHPKYYQRLKAAAACAAFGGYIVPGTNETKPYVEWWDSWRFWESLAAGCVTFHIDFDKYGAVLPVMPKNGQHYIGIDLDKLEDIVRRIATNPEILERISISGRQWAMENYGPIPTAVRFLNRISGNPSQIDPDLTSKAHPLTLSLPIQLSEINLIIFPDWSQEETSLTDEFSNVIRAIATCPDKRHITLLIDTSGISEQDANLVLSGVVMNLLLQEDLDVTEEPKISLIGQLDLIQWQALLPRLHARIQLEQENQDLIAAANAENIPVWKVDNLIS
jgi:hypothetical protein